MKIKSSSMISYNKHLFLLLFVTFFSFSLFAKERKIEKLFGNNSECVGQITSTFNETIVYTESLSSDRVVLSRKTGIELSIDDFAAPFYMYNVGIDLKITPLLVNGTNGAPFSIHLKAVNSKYGNFGNTVDLNKYLINDMGVIGANVEIQSFSVINLENNSNVTELPSNILLRLTHIEEIYYQLNQNELIQSSVSIDNVDNTLSFNWLEVNEAEEYELEWTWVDNYGTGTTPLTETEILFSSRDFELNNTRIQTKNNFYKIPLTFSSGYIIFRLRAIGRFVDTVNPIQASKKNFYGNWNSNNLASTVAEWGNNKIQINSHFHDLNWQFQTSYAENGKKKDVISYFDGTLRNRQTVTKTNSNNKTIVGEVIYDEEGRAAIEVLPVPILDPAIRYYPNFNVVDIIEQPYSYKDFVSLNNENCNYQTQGMSTIQEGASRYYSGENGINNNYQDFIPNAEKFPFSQIQYTNDNTGRVAKKGGVGINHQLSTGHEMKYFYSVPTQEELNKLFGYHVGNALHYKKNIVIDPNNQVSVSYLDPQGRTIATALAGDSPRNMVELSDAKNEAVFNHFDLLNKLSQTDVDTERDNNFKSLNNYDNLFDGLNYDAQKVNTLENTLYTFNYQLNNPTAFKAFCETSQGNLELYYPHLYKLSLDFKDECGETLYEYNQNVGQVEIDNESIVSVSQNTPTSLTLDTISFSPPVGTFGVSKKLIVNEEALNLFADDYIEKAMASGCILGYSNPEVIISGCMTTCELCESELVSMTFAEYTGKDAYIAKMLASNFELNQMIEQGSNGNQYNDLRSILIIRYEREFDLLLEECRRPCATPGISIGNNSQERLESISCNNSLTQLLADVLPSGQYGVGVTNINENGDTQDEQNSDTPLNVNDFPLSVYNENNELFVKVSGISENEKSWRHPHYFNINNFNIGSNNDDYKHYFNENGQIEYVNIIWDQEHNTFNPPLIPIYNDLDSYSTTFGSINTIGINSEASFKIEPQYLANVEDFITLINQKEHWALSLIKFHPEFHYLEYQYAFCDASYNKVINLEVNPNNSGTETITVNSDGFDELLDQIDSYEKAKNAGLLDNSNNEDALAIFNLDPYFQIPHPMDGVQIQKVSGNIISVDDIPNDLRGKFLIARRSIMERALNKTSTSEGTSQIYTDDSRGYDDTNKIMVRAVFDVIACNGVGFACNLSPNASFSEVIGAIDNLANQFSEDDKDRFWEYYKSYYKSLKQKIQHAFINVHAARQGAYNDCIGKEESQNFNTITSVLNDYPQERNAIRTWRGDGNLHDSFNLDTNLCQHISNTSVELSELEKRFLPFDGLYNSEQSGQQILNGIISQANVEYYQETGVCPMLRDLELFLDEASRRGSMIKVFNGSTTVNPQPIMNFITPALLAAIGGDYNFHDNTTLQNNFRVNASTLTANQLTVTFNFQQNSPNGSIVSSPFSLTLPDTLPNGINWSNYGLSSGSGWSILSMRQIAYNGIVSSNYKFNILATIKLANGTIFEKVLSGTTKANLTCGTTINNNNANVLDLGDLADCDVKKDFAANFRTLLIALKNDGLINVANQDITNKSYFVSSPLHSFLSVQSGDIVKWNGSIGNYSLSINNIQRLRIVINTTGSNPQGINLNETLYSLNIGQVTNEYHHIDGTITNSANESQIFEGTMSGRNSRPLLLTCCSSCGDEDADGDGIGDNSFFNPESCDTCDDRIDENNDGITDCFCENNECGLCNRKRIAFVFKVNQDVFSCDHSKDLSRELIEFKLANTGDHGFEFYACDDAQDNSARVKGPIENSSSFDYSVDEISCDDVNVRRVTNASGGFVNIYFLQNNYYNGTIRNINNKLQNDAVPALELNRRKMDLVFYFISINDVHTPEVFESFRAYFDSETGRAKRPFFVFMTNNEGIVRLIDNPMRPNHIVSNVTAVNHLGPILQQINSVNSLVSATPIEYNGTNADTANYIVYTTDERNTGLYRSVGLENGLSNVLEDIFNTVEYPITSNECLISSSQVLRRYRVSAINNSQNTCPCIPQVVQPVACQEAYADYISFMNLRFGVASSQANQYANTDTVVKDGEERFCNSNMQYLVEGYKHYIQKFNISSSNMVNYLDIATFGATALNYGYNFNGQGYQPVIDEYFTLLQNSNEDDKKTWSEFAKIYLVNNPFICPPKPLISIVQEIVPVKNNCIEYTTNLSEAYNQDAYNTYIKTKRDEFIKGYLQSAINNVVEQFHMDFADKEYQYTLYYYDQAGNLIQTVAPEGVDKLDANLNLPINQERLDNSDSENSTLLPDHKFKTQYKYNSLNQLVWQKTPDGGETRFAYDRLGRIIASQNENQKNYIVESPLTFNLESALNTENYNTVRKNHNNTSWENSGGFVQQLVKPEGTIEYRINENAYNEGVIAGLSYVNNVLNNEYVDYCFYQDGNMGLHINILGEDIGDVFTIQENDILKIKRNQGVIQFYKNQTLLHETTEGHPTAVMIFDFALRNFKSTITDLIISNVSIPDFSYTKYDNLGRISEAGQFSAKEEFESLKIDDSGKLVVLNNDSFILVNDVDYPYNISDFQTEVTKTLYDNYAINSSLEFNPNDYLTPTTRRNTRNRVTSILTYKYLNNTTDLLDFETALFYTYDIHGNVSEMAQVIGKSIMRHPNEPQGIIKRTSYEYDLISGNVNKVYYQKGKEDQFIHAYTYDADNRIVDTKTSKDGEIWETDASYTYYDHGPLAKTTLGDKKVQGIDFAYTLQGWLKTVNSESLTNENYDIGKDGNYISKDAFGYSLTYYDDDYKPINNGSINAHPISNDGSVYSGRDLYNGNIKRMITSVRNLNEEKLPTQFNVYEYDQLNRIRDMISTKVSLNDNRISSAPSHSSNYTYDRNGNFITLNRTAPLLNSSTGIETPETRMDNFNYNYIPETNKLSHVDDDDELNRTNFDNDIDDQYENYYQYDRIGQLIRDGASNINWRVDGKVKSIQVHSELTYLFFYDGLGNRIAKKTDKGRNGFGSSTYYSRDAQGNVMGVYETRFDSNENAITHTLKEHHIYGSSRLGIQEYQKTTTDHYYRVVGDKRYELSNHLGNVVSVINDKKIVPNEVRLIYSNSFNRDSNWVAANEDGEVLLDEDEENLLVTVNENSLSGASMTLNLDINQTVILNFNIQKDEVFPTSIPLQIEVKNVNTDEVIWNYTILSDGVFSGSFTVPQTSNYLITLSTENTTENSLQYTVDDFYVYTLPSSTSDFVSLYMPDVLAYNDYYPFGSIIPNRHGSVDDYRYGFQGQEKDDEIKGEGNFIAYSDRGYDPRIGRFISVDAYANVMPSQSPYSFGLNSPIYFVDENGNWPKPSDLLPKNTSPMIKGIVDGLWEGLTGSLGFAYDYATDEKFREQVNQSFAKLISDPTGTLGDIIDKYAGKIERLATGNATDDDLYDVGSEIGEAGVGVLLGGATLGVKLLKKVVKPDIDKGDIAKKAKKNLKENAEGGAYGRMNNKKDNDGKNTTEKNHLPTKNAYKLAGFSITDYMGTAHIMDKIDHRKFISTGKGADAKKFRAAEAKLLKSGRFLDAFDLNANAIKKQFGNKYDKGIQQAREQYIKEVIPKLEAQYKKANP